MVQENKGLFTKIAEKASYYAGSNYVFIGAISVVLLWAVSGPIFGFSDTWQLVINTGTTIITFLMVFLIQNTQNRDTAAMQIKLDELIRSTKGAHNVLLDLEEFDEEKLQVIRKKFESIAEESRKLMKKGKQDTGTTKKIFDKEFNEEMLHISKKAEKR